MQKHSYTSCVNGLCWRKPEPAPRGVFRGHAPQIIACAPPSEDCAPKKVTGLVPLKCSSRSETPKMLVITPEFVCKNSFFVDFVMSTHFSAWFYPRTRRNSHTFWDEDLLFSFWSSPQHSWKSVHISKRRLFFFFGLYPRIREILPGTPLFLGPRSQIQSIKVFVTPTNFLCPPPQSHYPGAGPEGSYC